MNFHPLKCNFYKKNKLYELVEDKKELINLNRNDYEILFEINLNNEISTHFNKDKLIIGDMFYDETNKRIWIFSFYKNNNYSLTSDIDVINHASSINGFGFIYYKLGLEPFKYKIDKYRECKQPEFIGNIFLKINKNKKYKDLIYTLDKGSANYKSLKYFNLNVDFLYFTKNETKTIFNPSKNDGHRFFKYKDNFQVKMSKTYLDSFFNRTEKNIYKIINLIKYKDKENKYIVNELISYTGNLFCLNSLILSDDYKKEIIQILKDKYSIFLKKNIDEKDIIDSIYYHSEMFIILNEEGSISYISANFSKNKHYDFDLLSLLQPNRKLIFQEIEISLSNDFYINRYLKVI